MGRRAMLRAGEGRVCTGNEPPLAAGQAPRTATLAQLKAQENYYSYVFTEAAVEEARVYSRCQARASPAALGCYCVVTDRNKNPEEGLSHYAFSLSCFVFHPECVCVCVSVRITKDFFLCTKLYALLETQCA